MKKRAVTMATDQERPTDQDPSPVLPPVNDDRALRSEPAETGAMDANFSPSYEDMLERSIPHYATMRDAVTTMACRYASPQTTILDLGCASGDAIAPLIDRLAGDNTFLGCDANASMLSAARRRFAESIENGSVSIQPVDLRKSYPEVTASVTLAVLTLQCIPLEYRQQLLKRIWQHTRPGGALIIVEKLLGSTAEIDNHLADASHGVKNSNDYAYALNQVDQKQRDIEGVPMPLTAHMNEEMLRAAGFTQIECFWRYLNFGAWIAVREPAQIAAPVTTQALRGAIIVSENTPAAMLGATRELLSAMMERNDLDRSAIISAFFTVTSDLNAAFPAKAARQLGWHHVALLCAQEIPIPGSMASCIRVLLHFNTTRQRATYHSVYLHGAEQLLQDDCETCA